ncbi:MAG: hypothetical protein ACRD0Y_09705 [Terriglobales bacterium]
MELVKVLRSGGLRLAMTLIVAAGTCAYAVAPRAAAVPGSPSKLALKLTTELQHGQDKLVYAHFNAAMKKAMNPSAIGLLWHRLEGAYGNLKSFTSFGEKKPAAGYLNELVKCKFSRSTAPVILVWTIQTKDMKVGGLHIG